MENLTENAWIIGLGLVIAFLGGIPGIITIIQHYFNKPKPFFVFSDGVVFQGDMVAKKDWEKKLVFITGAFVNRGGAELYPVNISLIGDFQEIKHKGEPILARTLFAIKDFDNLITINDPLLVDFHVVREVQIKKPVYGYIGFLFDLSGDTKNLRGTNFKFLIKDIFGKEYICPIPSMGEGSLPIEERSGRFFPKSGVVIK